MNKTDCKKQIILFDGVCNMCNGFVSFLIKRDKRQRYVFTSLQSETSKLLLQQYGLDAHTLDSIVFLYPEKNKVLIKSRAALAVISGLGGLSYYLFYSSQILHRWLDYVAKNRYKWFGKSTCRIPLPEEADRFLV